MPADRRSARTTPWPPNAATERIDRAEVARVGDAVEGDDQRDAGRLRVDEVAGVGVLVGRHLQGQALVDRAVGEPVELAAGRLEDGDAALGRDLERLADPVVGVDPAGDVHRRDRDVGAQRLDAPSCGRRPSRWTPSDRWTGPSRARAALRAWPDAYPGLALRRLPPPRWPTARPSWPRGGTGARRPWAWGPCPRGPCGAGRRTRRSGPFFVDFAHRSASLGVAGHVSRFRPVGRATSAPRRGVLERDARGGELVADRVGRVEVACGAGGCAGRELVGLTSASRAVERVVGAVGATVPQTGSERVDAEHVGHRDDRRAAAGPRRGRRRRGRCCRHARSRGRPRAPRRR